MGDESRTPGRRATRPVRVGRHSIIVVADDDRVVDRFDRLFAGLESAHPSEPVITFEISGTGPFTTRRGDELLLASDDLTDHELAISRLANDIKLDDEPDLLHLHSAAVADGDDAVLFVGRSRSGKSTLAASMTRAGWAYVTDDQVAVRPDDRVLLPFARPVTLRADVLDDLDVIDEPAPQSVRPRIEVCPLEFGAVYRGDRLRTRLIVFPAFTPGGETALTRIDQVADTVTMLAANCFDSDRLGEIEGVEVLIELARTVPCHRLVHADLIEAERLVRRAFDEAVAPAAVAVDRLAPTADITPDEFSIVATAGVHTWLFGDGSAAGFDPTTRAMVALRAGEVALWQLLADPTPIADLLDHAGDDTTRAGLVRWLGQLRGFGLLRGAEAV